MSAEKQQSTEIVTEPKAKLQIRGGQIVGFDHEALFNFFYTDHSDKPKRWKLTGLHKDTLVGFFIGVRDDEKKVSIHETEIEVELKHGSSSNT